MRSQSTKRLCIGIYKIFSLYFVKITSAIWFPHIAAKRNVYQLLFSRHTNDVSYFGEEMKLLNGDSKSIVYHRRPGKMVPPLKY